MRGFKRHLPSAVWTRFINDMPQPQRTRAVPLTLKDTATSSPPRGPDQQAAARIGDIRCAVLRDAYVGGRPYVETTDAHAFGESTDVAYLCMGFRLAAAGTDWAIATRDGLLREALLRALGPTPGEQLLGVGPEVLDELHDRGIPTRIYIAYGPTGSAALPSPAAPDSGGRPPRCRPTRRSACGTTKMASAVSIPGRPGHPDQNQLVALVVGKGFNPIRESV
jgi:hypothetical protein